jgi:hypothetical protein
MAIESRWTVHLVSVVLWFSLAGCTLKKYFVSEEPERRAKELACRDIRDRAHAAVELDGDPYGEKTMNDLVRCGPKCVNPAKEVDQPTAMKAAHAIQVCDRDQAAAERFVTEAEQSAKEVHAVRQAKADKEKAKADAEEAGRLAKQQREQAAREAAAAKQRAAADKYHQDDEAVATELKACTDDKKPCIDRCKADAASAACVALGVYTVTGTTSDRFEKADAYFDVPCKAGMKPACKAQEKASKERSVVFAPVDAAWSNLVQIGDDLATKKFLQAFAAAHFSGPQSARGIQNMALHISMITKDDFCPAKKEFLKVSNATELAKRTKKHCDEDPPTATGLAGQEEVLTAQCRAVYATPCP